MKKVGTIEVTEQSTVEVKEETLLSWWAGQKAELEGRIQTLEDGMTKNRGYLQRILQLVNQAVEEKDSPQSVKSQPTIVEQHNKNRSKQSCLITVLSEHENYTFQPNEPGILAFKSVGFTSTLHLNQTLQEENVRGSSSEVKVDSKGLFGSSGPILPRPKLELQMFDGSNPRGWVRKCQKYFNLLGVPEEQKLDVAVMYLMEKAETWFDGYIMQKHRVTWHEFEKKTANQELTEEEIGQGNDVTNGALEISINAITGNVRHTTLRIQDLLEEFKEVFEEPEGMPPSRKHDHAIVLKQGTHQSISDPIDLLIITRLKWKNRLLICYPHLSYKTKSEHISKPWLLQPIPIPHNAWEVITMDFIEGLPPSAKQNCILVVIDKFTKYVDFMPLSHPYTVVQVVQVAKIYLDQVYKLHGPPKYCLPSRDRWATERLNQCLEQYLRRDSRVDAVQTMMQDKEQFNALLREQLMQASNRMKQIIDKHRTKRDFQVGEEVYLKLQPYRQTSLALRRNLKLAARYFDPTKYRKKLVILHIDWNCHQIQNCIQCFIQNQRAMQFFIQWTNMGPDDATWEDYTVLKNQFPDFDPWGQGSFGGGGIVMMEGILGKQADIIKPLAKWAQSSNDPEQNEVEEKQVNTCSPLGDILRGLVQVVLSVETDWWQHLCKLEIDKQGQELAGLKTESCLVVVRSASLVEMLAWAFYDGSDPYSALPLSCCGFVIANGLLVCILVLKASFFISLEFTKRLKQQIEETLPAWRSKNRTSELAVCCGGFHPESLAATIFHDQSRFECENTIPQVFPQSNIFQRNENRVILSRLLKIIFMNLGMASLAQAPSTSFITKIPQEPSPVTYALTDKSGVNFLDKSSELFETLPPESNDEALLTKAKDLTDTTNQPVAQLQFLKWPLCCSGLLFSSARAWYQLCVPEFGCNFDWTRDPLNDTVILDPIRATSSLGYLSSHMQFYWVPSASSSTNVDRDVDMTLGVTGLCTGMDDAQYQGLGLLVGTDSWCATHEGFLVCWFYSSSSSPAVFC
ncbi:hypothetical protein F3Y22_tig00112529pilonHSYRG00028 [Hibiscus syriacus]|uniref:Integrase catalytic domain-containing protein n=1 Tax=Hibiscus syriacus TaxID=106335 RepID=A0A6A2Y5J3_HIBSY|nr:hypothetical protein F3Y22_tig00112529pilonHSYRG00028 [Hibiscus syriacus]